MKKGNAFGGMQNLLNDYANLDGEPPAPKANTATNKLKAPGATLKPPAKTIGRSRSPANQKSPSGSKTNLKPPAKTIGRSRSPANQKSPSGSKTNLKPPAKPISRSRSPANKTPADHMVNSQSGIDYKSFQASIVKDILLQDSSKLGFNDPIDMNIGLFYKGGLTKVLTKKQASEMMTSEYLPYLKALQNNLVMNEEGFIVIDCNGDDVITDLDHYEKKNWVDSDFINNCEGYDWKELGSMGYDSGLYKNINPSNLIQGNIGDCYFIAALSVMAEQPNLISRLLKSNTPDSPKIVSAWLCDSGKFRSQVLDSMFPMNGSIPKMIRPNNEKIGTWQMFLEKAYAKLYGNYANLDLGHSTQAFRELTGAPTEYIDQDNQNEAWVTITTSLKKGFAISASTKSDLPQSSDVIAKHCYSVLEAVEISYKGGLKRFLLMKNPNGNMVKGNGTPLPKDILPLVEAKSALIKNLSNTAGMFWYGIMSVQKSFEVLSNCLIHPSYNCFSSFEITNKDENLGQFLYKAWAPKGTQTYISINRKNIKHFNHDKQDIKNLKYGVHRVIAFEIIENDIKILGNSFGAGQSVTTEITVNNQEFYIYVDNDYNSKVNLDLILSFYSNTPVHCEFLKEQSTLIRNDSQQKFLTSQLLSYAMKPNKKLEYKEFKKDDAKCQRYYGEMLGYVAFVYFNHGTSQTLTEDYSVSELKNCKLFYPFQKEKGNQLKVAPGSVAAVILKFGWDNNCSHVSRIGTVSLYAVDK